jgi:hypothetical protein
LNKEVFLPDAKAQTEVHLKLADSRRGQLSSFIMNSAPLRQRPLADVPDEAFIRRAIAEREKAGV